MIKINLTWLGQAGFFIETENNIRIMIDPYLSDSVEERMGNDFHRRIPIDFSFLTAEIDVLILTHSHGDHTDYQTLDFLLEKNKSVEIICTVSNYLELKKRYGNLHNYIQSVPDVCVTIGNVSIFIVKAYHTDPSAIGVVIEDGKKRLYHTGDTLYAPVLIQNMPYKIDYLLCPINGWGGNMNYYDAYKLVKQLNPKYVYPMHWDMFLPPWGEDVNNFINLFSNEEQERICILKHYQKNDLCD